MLLVLYIVFFKRGKTRRGIWFVLTQVLLERSLSKDGKRLKTKDLVSINLYIYIYIFDSVTHFNTLYRASFIILYCDQQMHNYFTNYHTATRFDTILSSSDSL